jgi:hypothetical protein
MAARLVCLLAFLAALAQTATAQIISIKTVPVAQADQFAIFPSRNIGMGSVSIALADPLADPFVNPAKGAVLSTPYFFGSPILYSISSDAGGGRSLPVAAALKSGSWFGGGALALQQVDPSRREVFQPPILDLAVPFRDDPPSVTNPRSQNNEMAYAMLGKSLPEGLSLGGSIFWAGLNAIDGVDLLYAGSSSIRQFGHAVDVRLGLLKQWEGDRSLEALVVYDRMRMTHDVLYFDRTWDPATQRAVWTPRLEHNPDWTDIWGLHLEYERPLSAPGWRIGWLATANRMSHPKIPNYEIMSIPRDPGYSSAFNFGVGLSRTHGGATFGFDVIYEPIWSDTWADAAEPVATRTGAIIPKGGKTIENDFRFSNAHLRMGIAQDVGETMALQLGLAVSAVHYWLTQYDNVQLSMRDLEESWVERTPTWGLALRFPELEVRYQGRVTTGTGRPGVEQNRRTFAERDAVLSAGSTILLAPSGPLTLTEVSVVTHQISFSVPLR